MDMTGEERIAAKRQIVWQALNNPNVLRKCIPNCESLEKKSPTEMLATVKFKVGPIPATFKGDVTLTNLNAPESYTLVVDGQGGIAGSAKGKLDVKLVEDGDETILTYKAGAEIGGRLAMLGSKMIDSSAKKVAASFFKKFSKIAAKRGAKTANRADKVTDEDGDE
ncbi:MAG: carbon monoxide dehydrogenase subunit G [Rhizobiaceae bacterium]|nr:carbon monoxide dehydrogenase subunit G [Rhizobiaceae bacterium]